MEYLLSVVFAQEWPRLFIFFTAVVCFLLRIPLLRSSVAEYLPSIYKGLGPTLSTEKDETGRERGKEERGKAYYEMESTLHQGQRHCHAILTSLIAIYCLGQALRWWWPILLWTATVLRGFGGGSSSSPSLIRRSRIHDPSKPTRLVFLDFILSPDPELSSSRGQAFFAGL